MGLIFKCGIFDIIGDIDPLGFAKLLSSPSLLEFSKLAPNSDSLTLYAREHEREAGVPVYTISRILFSFLTPWPCRLPQHPLCNLFLRSSDGEPPPLSDVSNEPNI